MPIDIEALKRNPQCIRLFSSRLSLTKEGKEYLASCPFHAEKTPSFKVYTKDGIWLWTCFGCAKTGNAIQFVQEKDGITFKEAITKAQEEMGDNSWETARDQVDRVFQPPVAAEKEHRTLTLAQIAPLERNLASSAAAKTWLGSRGISLETAKRLHLGFKQDLGSLAHGLAPEVIAGGWVAFPCIEGDVVKGIKYRSLAIKTFRKQPNMATTLYNLDDIDPLEPVYLVEGEPDAAVMVQAGFRAVSLPSASTTVTPEMRDQLMAADSVILAGDCDGGVGSAIMERLWRDLGDRAYLLKWPAGKKDANQTFLEVSGGDVAKFRETVDNLTVEAKGSPLPEFTSIQKALLAGTGGATVDHPLRLHFPFAGVDGMAILLPGSVLAFTATNTGMGKALANGTLVCGPAGWTSIEGLKTGDLVVGSDGKPYPVVGVFPQGIKDVYRVTFDDDTFVDCCEDHLWSVQSNWARCVGNGFRVRSVRQMMDQGLKTKHGGYRFQIKMTDPVQYETSKPLPIHPYLLGALIGDGCLCVGSITFTCAEPELLAHLEPLLPEGIRLKQNAGNKIQYILSTGLKGCPGRANALRHSLRNLCLLGSRSETKFIPGRYLLASVEDRIALLQGLMDTDGSASKSNSLSFCSVSRRLAEDVLSLVRSLGGTGSLKTQDRADGRTTLYCINLRLPDAIAPFRLKRKMARLSTKEYAHRKKIVSIEPAGSAEMTCIAVDSPDNLFVTKDYTVTHNTNWTNQLAIFSCRKHNEVVLNYQVELSAIEVANITAAHVLRKERNLLTAEDNHKAARILKDVRYYVGCDPTLNTATAVLDLLEKAIRRLGATIVILDHIHALCRGDNELRDQAEASRRIKTMAQTYGVKFIVVMQPRKADSKNKGKNLHITDVKGSGALIDDADALLVLHRNVVQNPDPNNPPMDNYEPETEVHCLKARSKGPGSAFTKLYFDGALATFTDITHAEPPPA